MKPFPTLKSKSPFSKKVLGQKRTFDAKSSVKSNSSNFPKLDSKLILAPIHQVTNLAFRLMCKEYGAGLVCTQLLSANALAIKNEPTLLLAKTNKKESP
ncbi:MAG: tRNA-dihydrouridine synthase, partial [Nanoarchaeota archaeon]